MIRTLLLAGAAGAVMAGAASAADLPRRAPPPLLPPVPVFTWTGLYFGVNAGYGFDVRDDVRNVSALYAGAPNAVVPAAFPGAGFGFANVDFSNRNAKDGFTGGGQVGYNYQFTPGSGLVIGIEADAQYVDFGRNRNAILPGAFGFAPGTTFFNPQGFNSLDFFGTVRGRIGYAVDRTLFYGTGGFAYGSGGGRDFGLPNSSRDTFQTGWTAGGGVEYALPTDSFLNVFHSSAVTLKVEALYVNLDQGNRNNGAFAANGNTVLNAGTPGVFYYDRVTGNDITARSLRSSTEFAVVRAGLNYKFGSY